MCNRRDLATSCTHQRGVPSVPGPGTLIYGRLCPALLRGRWTQYSWEQRKAPPVGSSPDDGQGALSVRCTQTSAGRGASESEGLGGHGGRGRGEARGLGKKTDEVTFPR